MITAVNLLSVVPMRKEASHKSEMVSQLLFGEYVEITEDTGDFMKVKCLYDDYEGWVQANQLTRTDQVLQTDRYVGVWSDEVQVNGNAVRVPFGAPVYTAAEPVRFGEADVRYLSGEKNTWDSAEKKLTAASFEKLYSFFLNTPYLWGGKSVFGIDCSGFTQQVFKMFGVKLLRDAYLQAEQGEKVEGIEQAGLGDLAFFQNENGKITHVGIVLENNQIVHASGKVRIDRLDEEGIVNRETGKKTHQLHSMRRFF